MVFITAFVVASLEKNGDGCLGSIDITGDWIGTMRSKLSFAYTFKEDDRGGKVVFAYAIPYSYTDLLKDLDKVKKNLMADENFVEYEDLTKGDMAE